MQDRHVKEASALQIASQAATARAEESEQRETSALDRERETATALAGAQGRVDTLTRETAALLKDRTRLRASVSDMEQALRELARRKEASEARMASYRDLLDRFSALIDAGRLSVKIVDGRMVVELATDVLFASGSAKLSDQGGDALDDVAQVLASLGERTFQVEGHTDNVPIATERYPSNWELASDRALVVVRRLIDAGVLPERVSASSYAEHQPVSDNKSADGRSQNRRIEIVVVPDLSLLPGHEELKALGT
jgi:chemotaxis protein MotB